MDRDIGRLLGRLKELGIDNNTLVFFTSDNGPSAEKSHDPEFFNSNGPLRGVKRDLYEGAIRVPMIARWPGRVPAGRESDQVWAFWDILPTLAETAGLPAVEAIDGLSMLPTLLSEEQRKIHEYLYWDYGHARDTFNQAARWGDWKGVRNGLNSPIELYDLALDPGEKENVAGRRPEVVRQIESILSEAFSPAPDYPIAEKEGKSQ
jgi:arylsulfatase A-like enzyme